MKTLLEENLRKNSDGFRPSFYFTFFIHLSVHDIGAFGKKTTTEIKWYSLEVFLFEFNINPYFCNLYYTIYWKFKSQMRKLSVLSFKHSIPNLYSHKDSSVLIIRLSREQTVLVFEQSGPQDIKPLFLCIKEDVLMTKLVSR